MIFLVLICIVIAGIIKHVTPSGMMVPTFALIAVCLWVAYDYMMLQRYKAKAACLTKDKDIQNANEEIHQLAANIHAADLEEEVEKPAEASAEDKPEQKHVNEFDIGMFNAATIPELHTQMGFGADTQIANRMKYMSLQAKLSQEIRARHNKHNLLPYFDEELRANEQRDWWDQEQDYLDAFM